MTLLRVTCRACGEAFESGVPLRREHLAGVKLRCLEVCPACGAAGEYAAQDYRDPEPAGPDAPSAEDPGTIA